MCTYHASTLSRSRIPSATCFAHMWTYDRALHASSLYNRGPSRAHCSQRMYFSFSYPQKTPQWRLHFGAPCGPNPLSVPASPVTPCPKPAPFIRRVHEPAMPSRASTPLAAGCLLGNVCALLRTGLPCAYTYVDLFVDMSRTCMKKRKALTVP